MVEHSPDINYELTLLDVPEGAECLLVEGQEICARGMLKGAGLSVGSGRTAHFRLYADGSSVEGREDSGWRALLQRRCSQGY